MLLRTHLFHSVVTTFSSLCCFQFISLQLCLPGIPNSSYFPLRVILYIPVGQFVLNSLFLRVSLLLKSFQEFLAAPTSSPETSTSQSAPPYSLTIFLQHPLHFTLDSTSFHLRLPLFGFNSVKFSTLPQTYIKHLLCSKCKRAFTAPTPCWVIQPTAHSAPLLVAFCVWTSLLPSKVTYCLRTAATCLLLLCASTGAYYWAQTLRPPLQPHSPFPCFVIYTLMVMQSTSQACFEGQRYFVQADSQLMVAPINIILIHPSHGPQFLKHKLLSIWSQRK